MENGAAALFLDPGLGKTSVVLSAFSKLLAKGVARKMLVIAPLRVCQLVWRQEGQEWTQFRHLKIELIHGPKKKQILSESDADIFLINPEGVAWLVDALKGKGWPFDTTVIDELTKFKNSRATRFKHLHGGKIGKGMTAKTYPNVVANSARRWGLTGTPAPNGLMDLFGQLLILDDGRTFGKWITHYRETYFTPGFTGFDYVLQPGAEERIQRKLEPIALRMKAEDYLTLPECVDDIIEVEMDKKARATYTRMKNEMVADLPEGEITAANAAAVTSKLKQMANGAVYTTVGHDEKRVVAHIHDAKLDALEALVEELNGQPLLVAYEFNHDLDRIRARFGKDMPYLGAGVTSAQAVEIERDWNANKIAVLPVHPASVGHGLNMQKGGAGHLCWFGVTWDLELYLQLIRRLLRSGTTASRIMNHIIAVRGTVDYVSLQAIRDKDVTQARLLQGLKGMLHGDADGYAAGLDAENEEKADMAIRKLTRPGADETAAPETVKPKGWGSKAEPSEETEETEGPAPDTDAKTSLFSKAVRDKLASDGGEAEEDDDMKQAMAALEAAKAKAAAKAAAAAKAEAEEKAAAEAASKAEADEKPKVTRKVVPKKDTKETDSDDSPFYAEGQSHTTAGQAGGAYLNINISGNRDDVLRLLRAMGNAA